MRVKLILAMTVAVMMVGFAASPDILHFVPADSQLVVEARDVRLVYQTLKEAGLEEQLLQGLQQLAKNKPGAIPFDTVTTEDLADLAASSLAVAMKFPIQDKAESSQLLMAFNFGSERLAKKILPLVVAKFAGSTPASFGPFVVFHSVIPKSAEGDKSEVHFDGDLYAAIGENMLIVSINVDIGKLISTWQAGGSPYQFPQPSAVPATYTSGKVIARLNVRASSFGEWVDKVMPKAEPQKENEKKEVNPGDITAQFSPEKIKQFIKSLGVENVDNIYLDFREDSGRLTSVGAITLLPRDGFINDYVGDLKTKQLQALPYLPADSRWVSGTTPDLPEFYKLLAGRFKAAFGQSADSIQAMLEMVVQMKLEVSLSQDLLPMIGTELGFLSMKAAPQNTQSKEMVLPMVGYAMPKDMATLDKTISGLVKSNLVKSEKSEMAGFPLYTITIEQAKTQLFILAMDKVFFLGQDSTQLKAVADSVKAGRTLAAAPEMKPLVDQLQPGSVSFAVYRLDPGELVGLIRAFNLPVSETLCQKTATTNNSSSFMMVRTQVSTNQVMHLTELPVDYFKSWFIQIAKAVANRTPAPAKPKDDTK